MTDQVRRAIDASGTLRRVVKSSPAQHAIQTVRGCRIAGPRFAVGQARGDTCTYRVGGVPVTVRHRTKDVAILTEVFGHRNPYEPPAGVPLHGPVTVRDLGGNIGLFGAYALARWDVVELVSFEPDPSNLRLLQQTARGHAAWRVEPVAASNVAGEMRFLAGGFSESREAFDDESASAVPMVDVLALNPVDLLKIDIEGGEWPILTDPRLADAARVIVLEWHESRCPTGDGQSAARELLSDAGYTAQVSTAVEVGNGVLWAWRD